MSRPSAPTRHINLPTTQVQALWHKKVLALDLGTSTGWALYSHDSVDRITSGTRRLATEKELREQRKTCLDRAADVRFLRLDTFLRVQLLPVDEIWFEDVKFVRSQAQGQLWAGFRTVVSLLYNRCEGAIYPIPVQTLKLSGAGHGNATKKMMLRAAQKSPFLAPYLQRLGRVPDDNEVDALLLLQMALHNRI